MRLSKTLSILAVGMSAAAFVAMSAARDGRGDLLIVWERSGGNADMVDKLVEIVEREEPRPQDQPDLHPARRDGAEARAGDLPSGEVPDLMGMDLIYGPQFEEAGQLVDITDQIKDWPELKTASPGHMAVATYDGPPLRRAALCRRLGALLQQGPVREGRPRPEQAADEPAEIREYADKITALGGDVKGYYPAGLLRRLQHLHRRPADVGLGRQDRADGRQRRAAASATASSRCCSGRATWSRPATSTRATGPRTARPSTCSSAPARSA